MSTETRAIIGIRVDIGYIRKIAHCECLNSVDYKHGFKFCPFCGQKIDKSVENTIREFNEKFKTELNSSNSRIFSTRYYLYIGRYISNTYTSLAKLNIDDITKTCNIIFDSMNLSHEVRQGVGLFMDIYTNNDSEGD